jgi:predicted dehydrogenase
LTQPTTPPASRRDFLKVSAATAGAALASGLIAPHVHAAGGDTLKVGLIGCGGRGTGAAGQALRADRNIKLVAVADAFSDRLERCLNDLRKEGDIASKIAVDKDHCFVGFDGYKSVIENVDVVLLATPPGFRPTHLEAAVKAGKHIFCEKPMAVDGPGIRKVIAAAEEAKKNNLSLVSGFCWRYDTIMRETMKRIHDGEIGEIRALQCLYNTGGLWMRKREAGWGDTEYQMRNWYYYAWLSGDFNVEQHIHSLDKAAWALKDEYPIKAVGLGGRQVRTSSDYGHIFDHHAVVYEYASGVKVFSYCRQQPNCANSTSDHIFGAKETCDVIASFPPRVKISGPRGWVSKPNGTEGDMYQIEHNELFASIRAGKPLNDGHFMAKSTLMGIMGRMTTYTGKEITWEQALNSKEDLLPKELDMKAVLPEPKVAMPGITKFS